MKVLMSESMLPIPQASSYFFPPGYVFTALSSNCLDWHLCKSGFWVLQELSHLVFVLLSIQATSKRPASLSFLKWLRQDDKKYLLSIYLPLYMADLTNSDCTLFCWYRILLNIMFGNASTSLALSCMETTPLLTYSPKPYTQPALGLKNPSPSTLLFR